MSTSDELRLGKFGNQGNFDINNEKIMLRHIYASALAFYWQKYESYYHKEIDGKKDNEMHLKNILFIYFTLKVFHFEISGKEDNEKHS